MQGSTSQALRQHTLNPKKIQCVAYGLVDLEEFYLTLEQQFSIKDDFWSLVTMPTNSYKILKSPSGGLYSIRKHRKENYPGAVFLSIEYSLILHNLVPFPMIVRFIEGDKSFQKTLAPNNVHVINQVNDIENIKISVMLPNSFWSQEERLMMGPDMSQGSKTSFMKNNAKFLYVQDANGLVVPVKLTCQKNNPNYLFLSLDHLLIDKISGSEVQYLQGAQLEGKNVFLKVNIGQRGILKAYSKNSYDIFVINPAFPIRVFKQGMCEDSETKYIDLNTIEGTRELTLDYKKDGSEEVISLPISIRVHENLLRKEIYKQLFA